LGVRVDDEKNSRKLQRNFEERKFSKKKNEEREDDLNIIGCQS